MKRIFFPFLIIIALMIFGCGESVSNNEGTSDELRQMLDGSTFISKEQFEIGLGPDGNEVLGKWGIYFQGENVNWSHSDANDFGTYTVLNDGSITAFFHLISVDASINVSTNELIWDGALYNLQVE